MYAFVDSVELEIYSKGLIRLSSDKSFLLYTLRRVIFLSDI